MRIGRRMFWYSHFVRCFVASLLLSSRLVRYTTYEVVVRMGGRQWSVRKRYSQFDQFRMVCWCVVVNAVSIVHALLQQACRHLAYWKA